jgi:hypothetical protein
MKCHALRLEAGSVEPLYCSLELVDIAKQISISERFHFDGHLFPVINEFFDDLKVILHEHVLTFSTNKHFNVT